jgi:hypothetical protein
MGGPPTIRDKVREGNQTYWLCANSQNELLRSRNNDFADVLAGLGVAACVCDVLQVKSFINYRDKFRIPSEQTSRIVSLRGARPHAVRPRSARTTQISKHAPTNPAIR